jgi:hypothetical protein
MADVRSFHIGSSDYDIRSLVSLTETFFNFHWWMIGLFSDQIFTFLTVLAYYTHLEFIVKHFQDQFAFFKVVLHPFGNIA